MKLIESVAGAEELVNTILYAYNTDTYTVVLGVDCEGISKDRPLSLIQVCVREEVFVIDLFKVNPFIYGLKEIMESDYIVKVFHDFCEDAAALVNQYGVVCRCIFDTQIAHRMLTEALQGDGGKNDFKHNNIGLNDLLQSYIGEENECKNLIQSEMKNNRYFWETRPLTESMLKYASQDVIFLPPLYTSFYDANEQRKRSKNKAIARVNFEISEVFHQAMKCNEYAMINRSIDKLKNGDCIQAFVKNIQKFGTYCSLNLGITGLINHKRSRKYIMSHHQIGDIVDVLIDSIQKKNNKVLLKLACCADSNSDFPDDSDPIYNEGYYDDFNINEGPYYGVDQPINEFSEEYPDGQYYDSSQLKQPMTLSQSMSYDRLIGVPEMSMYHPDVKQYNSVQNAPGELGYSPYQNDIQNTTSTTYSYHNMSMGEKKLGSPKPDSLQPKSQLHKNSPAFKKKTPTLESTKSAEAVKTKAKSKLSSAAREFILPKTVTNENVSENALVKEIKEAKQASENVQVSEPEPEQEDAKAKIKLNKESRPFTKYNASDSVSSKEKRTKQKSSLSIDSKLFMRKLGEKADSN